MPPNLPKCCSPFFLALSLSLLTGCAASAGRGLPANANRADDGWPPNAREVALGEQFKIGRDEKVSVRETPLAVELKNVRRSWHVDHKAERVDAEIIITFDGGETRQWLQVGQEKTVGGYDVKLWGADPFGKTSATLIVTRS